MLQKRLLIALATLRQQAEVDATRVAAIGFCFGGLCVLDIARTGEELAGVVSFHGLLGGPANAPGNAINTKILVLHGWDDPMAKPEAVIALASELSAAGADWQNPNADNRNMGTVYDATADRRSWRAMTNFFDELFGG
jgi:dienelactone hydrolase